MTLSWLFVGYMVLTALPLVFGQWRRSSDLSSEDLMKEPRLPQTIKPTSYVLKLHPHITDSYFTGSVEINILCHESTNNITLHAHHELNIPELIIRDNTGDDITIKKITRNITKETLTIVLGRALESNTQYQLYAEFGGNIKIENEYYRNHYNPYGSPTGFLSGMYRNQDSPTKRWYAATNTFPKYARKVFPCFDEPAFKTTFKISVAHPSNMSALSVMPVESSEKAEENGWVWDHFAPTPPLSTFSINVAITELKPEPPSVLSTAEGNISINYHHRKLPYLDTLPSSERASVPNVMEYIANTLGIQYPLPKLDVMGVPAYHYELSSGSFGLLILHEFMLIERSPDLTRDVVSQWFRHMATPEWWDSFNVTDILTFYLTSNAVKKLGLTMLWYQVQKDSLYKAYSSDFSHVNKWNQPEMQLGGWFLEMLNESLSQETLHTALGNFISNHLYSTYNESNLWEEITRQGHEDGTLPESLTVEMLANSWLKKNNNRFPVLTVIRDYETDTAFLLQYMFFMDPSYNITKKEAEQVWWIPITYLTPCRLMTSAVRPEAWMNESDMILSNLPDANSFIIVNPTDAGMFLVNYDDRNWDLLAQALLSDKDKIPREPRKKLLQDALLLAAGGELDYGTALNITMFLMSETDYTVWIPFLNQINQLQSICHFTTAEEKLNTYIRQLVSPLFESSNYPDHMTADYDFTMFWYQARDLLESVGYQPFIDEVYNEMNKTIQMTSYYDNDTQLVLLCPKDNETDNWSRFSEQMQRSAHYRNYLDRGICKCPGYGDFIDRSLNATLDEEASFRSHEFVQYIRVITSCPESHAKAFDFFLDHFDQLRHRFYFVKDMWRALVQAVTNKVRTNEQLTRLKKFYEEKKDRLGYTKSTVRHAIKQAEAVVDKKENGLQEINFWLQEVLPAFDLRM